MILLMQGVLLIGASPLSKFYRAGIIVYSGRVISI